MDTIADLDVLVLRCRSERAKAYLREAVAAYRAGAYRLAIIACWSAVVFDYIDKMRELDFSGHKDAKEEMRSFEAALEAETKNDQYGPLLDFERQLLDKCLHKFEFLTRAAFEDLERLRKDRNRSAHPSMSSRDEAYQPTAEQARYHIRSVVEHMLSNPPVQGKAALDGVLATIDHPGFPIDVEGARAVLQPGPLKTPRSALLRNYVLVAIKSVIREPAPSEDSLKRRLAALEAVRDMHPAEVAQLLRDEIERTAFGSGGNLVAVAERLLRLLERFPDVAEELDEAHVDALRAVVGASSQDDVILSAAVLPQFSEAALSRAELVSLVELNSRLRQTTVKRGHVDLAVRVLAAADSFNAANSVIRSALKWIPERLDISQARAVLDAVRANPQVAGAYDVPDFVVSLVDRSDNVLRDLLLAFAGDLDDDPNIAPGLSASNQQRILAAIRARFPVH